MSRKILYICAAAPYGETYGMGLRSRNVGKLLQLSGEVTMLPITANPWSERDILESRKHFHIPRVITPKKTPSSLADKIQREFSPSFLNTHSLGLAPDDARAIDEALRDHDLVWIHTIKMANIVGRERWPKTVLDVDDYPSQFHRTVVENSTSLKERMLRRRRAFLWSLREKRLKRRFPAIVVCKEADRSAFGVPERTFVVGNGFESFPIQRLSLPELAAQPRLGLIGNFNYRLNSDAIEWFLQNAWEHVRAAAPDARLRLVGRGSERYASADRQVDGLGFVDDPAAELASWAALVAPTRMGGGTSVKIAEAFSRRVPVIATPHGARGYGVQPGHGILVADDAKTFAQHCIELIKDPKRGAALAANAGTYFENSLTWDSMLPELTKALAAAENQAVS